MRRTVLATMLLTAVGVALTGATTCGPQGPAARDFAAGSLVIPMDNCYQRRDGGAGTAPCNANPDDGVFRAYGLVYFLLKHNVTVYWAVDNTKTSATQPDLTVTASSGVVAQKMTWGGTFGDIAGLGSTISYMGGPFVIDGADVNAVLSLFQSDPDFARFKSEAIVDVHQVKAAFHANQVRPLTGPPPKLAILNINPNNKKTSVDVMYRYAVAAGLDWPCTPANGDCAGGVSGDGTDSTAQGCKLSALQAYLTNTGAFAGTGYVNPAITTAMFNNGPGKVYDILCDNDFYAASGTYGDTLLSKNGYKLLWAPHWEEGTQASATPAVPPRTAADFLGLQLAAIRGFVDAGNNVFAECHAIFTLEGGTGSSGTEYGLPITRFQSTSSMTQRNSTANVALAFSPSAYPDPKMQVGDFPYAVTTGSVSAYLPDPAATQYVPGVKRLITETTSGNLDVATSIVVTGADGAQKGSVIYLGGHDYSPGSNSAQTAGTRIVLNTLFNLGFGCADPNSACTTGLLGACAQGVLKCAGGGGLQCTGPQAGALDCTTPGADANCNGIPDVNEQGCQPVACAEGAKESCYDGPAATAGVGVCKAGTRTCTGGLWGACVGQVLPQPEVCNGRDDNCDGHIDEGALCGSGYACQSGICLPTGCNNESARCPAGFECLTTGGACTAVPCGTTNTACGPGTICQSGACVDPCAAVTCGPGAGCAGGQCVAGGCALTGCGTIGQVCVEGTCVADPCAGASCPEGTFCRIGPQVNGAFTADCVRSCSYVGCPGGQTCDADGFCEAPCPSPCPAGQACTSGVCAKDPCAGVICGAGQDCQGGACIDSACRHVSCPVGQCAAGQCVNGGKTTSQSTPIKPASSGGCGTGGHADLAALLLAAVALASRRSRFLPAVARVASRAAPLALAIVLALGAACSKSGDPACKAPQTACGADCVDLQTSSLHCGACGHGCASGFECLAGTCTLPTGNPHLVAVSPSALGLGASPALELTFDGLAQPPSAMLVRLTGGVRPQELPLTVTSAGKATLAAQAIDVTGEVIGSTIEVRLLNMPGRLVSNALPIAVVDALVARSLTPALARQDTAGDVPLSVQGLGFVSGATVTFKNAASGAAQTITPASVTANQLQFTPPPPSTLAVGRYDVTVTNPGGATSGPVAFTVTDGAPQLTSVTGTKGTCVQGGGPFSGTAQGSFVYPSSVVHVSGNSIANSPLATDCLNGTDALGQCIGGQLRVSADLTAVPAGNYDVTIVNPGPTPLVSNKLTITVATACP